MTLPAEWRFRSRWARGRPNNVSDVLETCDCGRIKNKSSKVSTGWPAYAERWIFIAAGTRKWHFRRSPGLFMLRVRHPVHERKTTVVSISAASNWSISVYGLRARVLIKTTVNSDFTSSTRLYANVQGLGNYSNKPFDSGANRSRVERGPETRICRCRLARHIKHRSRRRITRARCAHRVEN
jgi:hypothetical protein